MKKLIFPTILSIIIGLELFFLGDITLYVSRILNNHPDLNIEPQNEYSKHYNFLYVKQDHNYIPYNYGDILNIYYSIINNGWEAFTFYCPEEYENCVKDVQTISTNNSLLTNINNYVNPLNSFYVVQTSYDDSGEINVKIEHLYNKEKINFVNQEIDKIMNNSIKDNMTDIEKIKAVHDYIINHTKYDVERNNYGTSMYESNTAYGLLKDHYAICSGYSDTMAIILNRLNIENYKIASTDHLWNAVKLNGQWYHLDLTWDDPVSDYEDILDHKYFLIDNEELVKLDEGIKDHIFDKSIYLEFK